MVSYLLTTLFPLYDSVRASALHAISYVVGEEAVCLHNEIAKGSKDYLVGE